MSGSVELSKEELFSLVEKAVKPQFFLLIFSFVLLFDASLVRFHHVGLFELGTSNLSTSTVGITLILTFLAFSGLASMILPFLYIASIQLYIATIYSFCLWLKQKIEPDNEPIHYTGPKRRERDRVRPWELREEAHKTQSDFLIQLYNTYDTTRKQEQINQRRVDFFAFCTLCFLVLNCCLPSSPQAQTLAQMSITYFSTTTHIWLSLSVFAVIAFHSLHDDTYEKRWIYCPPLHNALEDKDEEKRKQERQFQEEIKIRSEISRRRREETLE
ncbi:hypothetical protein HX870_05045 [Pseudomonas gingeri]|jgi:hypothetical protein|uniref:hypothetical protein n=1 Tax=Pseudomonas gingeri TaxID=117681 RepID=UPI0015A2BBD8|nr:hypothetical protein [Pseudomonas gingeri]NWD66965.1 hypothetical protein [Pseudomonas gingeri]